MPATTGIIPAAYPFTISDVLNAIDLRGRTWCYLDLTNSGGFAVKPSDAVILHIVLAGSVMMARSGGPASHVSEGDGLVVMSGEAHAVRASAGAEAHPLDFLAAEQSVDLPATFRLGRPGPYAARLLSARLQPSWPDGHYRTALPPVLFLSDREKPRNDMFLGPELLQRYGFGPGATVMLTRLATVLLSQALRDHLLVRTSKDIVVIDPVAKARELVDLHPGADWTVEKLARSVGMGRSNFSAHFSRDVGMPPMEFVTDIRMQKAEELVRHSNMAIQDIAEAMGYNCQVSFNRRFSRQFGMSPGSMRQRAYAPQNDTAIEFTILRGYPLSSVPGNSSEPKE